MNESHLKPEMQTFLSALADFTGSHSTITFGEKKIPFLPMNSVRFKCGKTRTCKDNSHCGPIARLLGRRKQERAKGLILDL